MKISEFDFEDNIDGDDIDEEGAIFRGLLAEYADGHEVGCLDGSDSLESLEDTLRPPRLIWLRSLEMVLGVWRQLRLPVLQVRETGWAASGMRHCP